VIGAVVRALAVGELVGIVLMALVLVARRLLLRITEGRQRRRLAPYEEAVLELLCADASEGAAPALAPLAARSADAAVGRVLAVYAASVKGSARDRLTAFAERTGYVDAALRELTRWSDWRRGRAALTLGDLGSAAAVAPLREAAVSDGSARVRSAAVRALGQIGGAAAAESVLEAWLRARVPSGVAAQALLDIGAPAAPALLAAARDGRSGVRATACRSLGHIGVDGRPDVVMRLAALAVDDEDAGVRAAACGAIGAAGSDDAAFALASAMSDASPVVRAAACDAAARLQIADLQQIAARLTHDPEPRVARSAARAVAAVRPVAVRAMPFGREALADREWRAA
jgi:HEAT repeat protein